MIHGQLLQSFAAGGSRLGYRTRSRSRDITMTLSTFFLLAGSIAAAISNVLEPEGSYESWNWGSADGAKAARERIQQPAAGVYEQRREWGKGLLYTK